MILPLRLPARALLCFLVTAWFAFGSTTPASGFLCGDDVDGEDVPCHCGDIVVSDLVLTDDPVLGEVCTGDGLVIRARNGADGLTIDLAGHHLRGSGSGTGVRILDGGTGGARIFSRGAPAVVEGFRDGIVSQTSRFGVVELLDVELHGSQRDGLRIFGDGLLVRNVTVVDSGRDGVFVRGSGWTVEDVTARGNGRHGVTLMGTGHTVRPGATRHSLRAEANGGDGVRLWGSDHRLRACRAAGNARTGVALNGERLDLNECEARANGGPGISGVATLTRFFDNRAIDNLGGGIAVHGHTLLDGGGNVADGNSGRARASASECRLGLEDCQ